MIILSLFAALTLATSGADEDALSSLVDSEKIIEGILSKGSVSSAWNAYYAGKLGVEECVPALLELIERENQRDPHPVPPVKKAALDALISLDSDVPFEYLRAGLHADYIAETLILLARDPEINMQALLDLMDFGTVKDQHWWATAGILASLEPKGLAARLLPEVRLSLSVAVRDPGSQESLHHFEGYGGRGFWRSTGTLFPPRPTYVFTTRPKKGAVVLQAKPVVIYYLRSEGARSGISAVGLGHTTRSKFALSCIVAMIDGPKDGLLTECEHRREIDWIDEGDLRKKIDAAIDQLHARFGRLLHTLRMEGLLAPGACEEMLPEIKVHVQDVREIKSPPLREFPAKK